MQKALPLCSSAVRSAWRSATPTLARRGRRAAAASGRLRVGAGRAQRRVYVPSFVTYWLSYQL
eukprot:572236-Prymnesium_polylepis.1